MNQLYRRKFLALERLPADESLLHEHFRALIAGIRAAPIEQWPYGVDVRDVLMSIGLAPAVVDELAVRYEREVWGGALVS